MKNINFYCYQLENINKKNKNNLKNYFSFLTQINFLILNL